MPSAAVNDDVHNKKDNGPSCLRLIIFFLLIIVFTSFSIAVSGRCYVNDMFYESLWGVLELFAILLLLMLIKKVRENRVVSFAVIFSPYIFVFYYALLSFLIFTTSSESVQFQTQFTNSERGRGCGTKYWTFYNRPIHREISICGDGVISGSPWGAISVTEKVGLFGAYIQHVDKIP